jgi:hypothetical protein
LFDLFYYEKIKKIVATWYELLGYEELKQPSVQLILTSASTPLNSSTRLIINCNHYPS